MSVRTDKQEDQADCLYTTMSVRIDKQNDQAKKVETSRDHYPYKVWAECRVKTPSHVQRTDSNKTEVVKGLWWRTPRVVLLVEII